MQGGFEYLHYEFSLKDPEDVDGFYYSSDFMDNKGLNQEKKPSAHSIIDNDPEIQGGFEYLNYEFAIQDPEDIYEFALQNLKNIDNYHYLSDLNNQNGEEKISSYSKIDNQGENLAGESYCFTFVPKKLLNEEGEDLDLINLIHRCEGDIQLAIAITKDFFSQGATCCSDIQKSLKISQLDQLLFHTVSHFVFSLDSVTEYFFECN